MSSLCNVYRVKIAINVFNRRLYATKRIKPTRMRSIKGKYEEIRISRNDPSPEDLRYGTGGKTVIRANMANTLRRLGLSEREFVRHDPLNDLDDDLDECQDVMDHPDKYYDMHLQEKRDLKNLIRHKHFIQKYYPEPKETNLLTVAAKEQIKYLHALDPVKWSPDTLPLSFPISKEGVKKLLRGKYIPKTRKERWKHDRVVSENIKLLKEGSEKIMDKTRTLWQEGKLKIEHSQGNVALPIPEMDINDSKELSTIKDLERPGEFLSIVKPYLDTKKRLESKDSHNQPEILNHHHLPPLPPPIHAKENFYKVVLPTQREPDTDPLSASYFDSRLKYKDNVDVTHKQSGKMINAKDTCKDDKSEQNQNSTYNKNNNENTDYLFSESKKTPKHEKDTIELVIDSRRNQAKDKVQPYFYDSVTGYQHPLGEADDYSEQIEIPKHVYKEGSLYKVGNCYYDDKGEFLYKTFS